MSKDWRTVLRFSVLGLAIATVFFVFFKTESLMDGPMAIYVIGAALLLCPGFIPFAWAAAIEMDTPGFGLIWLIVGAINCVLYGFVGAAYVRFQKWRGRAAAT